MIMIRHVYAVFCLVGCLLWQSYAQSMGKLEAETLQLVNTYRQQQGKPALVHDSLLYQYALQHAENMAKGRVPFGHDGFYLRIEMVQKERAVHSAAENVAYIPVSNNISQIAYEAWEGWYESPGHNANMLGDFTHTGLAAVRAGNYYYFVQLFASYQSR